MKEHNSGIKNELNRKGKKGGDISRLEKACMMEENY